MKLDAVDSVDGFFDKPEEIDKACEEVVDKLSLDEPTAGPEAVGEKAVRGDADGE